MHTKLVEGVNPDGLYLKAMVATFDNEEWRRRSLVGAEVGVEVSLLRQESWTRHDFWILDISRPGPGGKFTMGRDYQDAGPAMTNLPVTF